MIIVASNEPLNDQSYPESDSESCAGSNPGDRVAGLNSQPGIWLHPTSAAPRAGLAEQIAFHAIERQSTSSSFTSATVRAGRQFRASPAEKG
ncbi:hypothetical protein [Bradyrhizobium genosp. SA-3]|uniref:hypothetical protein n=1 Tax=Bradyrhizobium genosp. SA-3 TaxID=508868 RepID=UPI00102A1C54|nr:hypothetical protein [Bradyrhizobium genosp. SA-3]